MANEFVDANFHNVPPPGATALTFGAVGTSAAGTVSPTTAAGATPTTAAVTGRDCTDRRGAFNLLPVTGGGAQAAGSVAVVKFAKEYAKIPSAVLVTIQNATDTTAAIVASANAVSTSGFNVLVGTALTTAKTYTVEYVVVP